MDEVERKLNKNRTYIYTDECVLCGKTEKYKNIANRLKTIGKDVFVKQTPLFIGWQQEAAEIGLSMPFVFDLDSKHWATCEELDKLDEGELKDWLGVGSKDEEM